MQRMSLPPRFPSRCIKLLISRNHVIWSLSAALLHSSFNIFHFFYQQPKHTEKGPLVIESMLMLYDGIFSDTPQAALFASHINIWQIAFFLILDIS